MRYHLDTIPVWDAFHAGGECPLCALEEKTEADYLDSFLGASVMEPLTRVEVNAKGFCAPHLQQMLGMQNRLGLSLMLHTHTLEILKTVEYALEPKKSLIGRRTTARKKVTCVLCERLTASMNRYFYTTVTLFRTDKTFRTLFLSGKGVCLPHAEALTQMAATEENQHDATQFLTALTKLQQDNLTRLAEELSFFTLQFDYRNQGRPWGDAKDAPERAVLKLRGRGRSCPPGQTRL